jgi:GNAT superfamily N-acetyltransferase
VTIVIRPGGVEDAPWVADLLAERWGGAVMIVHGDEFDLTRVPALVAWDEGRRVGLATVRRDPLGDAELMSLDSLEEGRGVGSALIEAACRWGQAAGATRLRVVTTNDNLRALSLYQRRGFRLTALRCGAVDAARRIKPSIPEVGEGGIPLHDEVELARALGQGTLFPSR